MSDSGVHPYENVILIIGNFLNIGAQHILKEPKEFVEFFETTIKPIEDFKTLVESISYWNKVVDNLSTTYPNYPIFYLDQNVGKLFFYVENFKTGIIYGYITNINIDSSILKGSGTPEISRERIESKTYFHKFKEPYNDVLVFKEDREDFINITTVRKLLEMYFTEKIIFECIENKTDTSQSYILLELFKESLLIPIDDIRTMIRFFIQKRTRIFRLEKIKDISKGTTYSTSKDESKSCEQIDKILYRIKPILPPVFQGKEVGGYGMYYRASSVAVAESGEVAVSHIVDTSEFPGVYVFHAQITINNGKNIKLGDSGFNYISKLIFSPNNELISFGLGGIRVFDLDGKPISPSYSTIIGGALDLAFSPYGIYKTTRDKISVYTYDGKLVREFGEGISKELLQQYGHVGFGFDKIGVTPEGKVFVTKIDREKYQPWGQNIRLVSCSYDGSNESVSTLKVSWRWLDTYKSIAITKDGNDDRLIASLYVTEPWSHIGGGIEGASGGVIGLATTGLDFTSSGKLYCCVYPVDLHYTTFQGATPNSVIKIYE